MAKPKALIVRAPGTNCDIETAYAFELAGAEALRVHVNQLIDKPSLADSFQILCFPGGFS
ncbi:MAG: phosphoribosylformylglycinamidine synthase subunit PurQ, partial [Pirellula sp.]